jgi:hypothetical protein
MTVLILPGAIAVLVSLSACASLPKAGCGGHERPAVADKLYFGSAGPHGQVTEAQWSRFLQSAITPRFPQGLTVLAATGQWLGNDGVPVSEMTHVLQIVHPSSDADETRVTQIIAAYRSQFEQESVLRVKVNACASF